MTHMALSFGLLIAAWHQR